MPADLQQMFTGVHLPLSFMKRDEDDANFVVGPDLRLIEAPPLGRLVRFGRRAGDGEEFCVNPATGEVVVVMEGIPPNFVNSSIDLLNHTIELARRFERQFTTGDAEECWTASEDFLDLLQQIDPPAADGANYWGAFAADAQAGDYSDNPNFSD